MELVGDISNLLLVRSFIQIPKIFNHNVLNNNVKRRFSKSSFRRNPIAHPNRDLIPIPDNSSNLILDKVVPSTNHFQKYEFPFFKVGIP